MKHSPALLALALSGAISAPALGGIIVDFTVDAGGSNPNPINGMAARATFDITGTTLTVLLENTSAGVPLGAEASDSLLVTLALDLDAVFIVSGDSAVIGPDSFGLGSWDGLVAGDSVADEWLWTNTGGGDLLIAYGNDISTSNGQGGGTETSFNGESDPNVAGPFGGIATDPALININPNQPAVSDSILFTLSLSQSLTQDQLLAMARSSIVEFGSDYQYLTVIPAPGPLSLILLTLTVRRRRRNRD